MPIQKSKCSETMFGSEDWTWVGLLQKEIAKRLCMTTDTITNWELNRTESGIRCYPAIIDFIGYVPFSMGKTCPEKLKAYRMVKGLSQRKLAKEIGVDETTLRVWEAGMGKPRPEKRERAAQLMQCPTMKNREQLCRDLL